MKSFTEAYFNYGYNTTVEKIAKEKDQGMGLGAKAALGLGGAAALGGLGYAGHQGYLGDSVQGAIGTGMDYLGDKSEAIADFAKEQGGNALDKSELVAEYIKQMAAKASHGVQDFGADAAQYGRELGQKGGHLLHDAKGYMGMNSALDNVVDFG